jgi:hypothetical protein
MKKTLLAALAIAGFAVTTGAQAQQISYTPGDALLMFRATTGTGADKNLYINLGNLTSASFTSFNLDFASAGNILQSTFGSDWNRNTVYWGVIGGDNAVPSFTYASGSAAQTGMNADNLWQITTAIDQAFYAGVGSLATVGTVADSNGNNHGYSVFSSDAGGSPTYQDGRGFAYFDVTTIINTQTQRSLYFYGVDGDYNVLAPVTTGTVSATGTSFAVQSIPEPSTYALIGFGTLLLVMAYRRRSNA